MFLANPNNPTGTYIPGAEVKRLRAMLPSHILLVLDAAYSEYVEKADYEPGDALVDAAIAKVNRSKDVTSVIRKIGVPKGVSTFLRRDMKVQKTGRTTDYTIGVITDIDYRLPLNYKKKGGGKGRVGLRDQVLCTRYTAGGDSGSAVLNMNEKVLREGLEIMESAIQHVNEVGHIEGNMPPFPTGVAGF